MAGRHAQAMEQIARAPFVQYLAVRDSRTRPTHRDLHGKVFRLDSPAWWVISPPRGYNCRCRARYLSQRELDVRGLKVQDDVRLLERAKDSPPGDRLTGESPERILQRGISLPDPEDPGRRIYSWTDLGWDHLPGSDGAERALVDRLMEKARDLGEGVREAVLARPPERVLARVAAAAEVTAGSAILRPGMSTEAYRAAMEGGRHAGWLENVRATMTPRQIRKAIASLDKQIAMHLAWIANPLSKPGMERASEADIRRCSDRKWPQDIARQTEQRDILRALLEDTTDGKGAGGA